jgi:hypothetical protein
MAANRILRLTNQGSALFYEGSGGGVSYAEVKAPAALAGNTLFQLPPNNGTAEFILRTDGSGVTTWVGTLPTLTVTTLSVSTLKAVDNGVVELYEAVGGGTNKVTLSAPAALGGDVVFTFPPNDGTADYLLRSDGSGVTTWVVTVPAFTITTLTTSTAKFADNGVAEFYEAVGGGTSKVTVAAAAALAGNVTFTLPTDNGTADFVLRSDGSGVTSWVGDLNTLTINTYLKVDNAAEVRFYEPSGSGTNYSAIKAQAQAGDITYTLPAAIVAGNFLQTDAGGALSWAASAATLQTAYAAGEDIVMIADTIEISQANNSTMMDLTKTGAGGGAVLVLHNDGTGGALDITQDGISTAQQIVQNTNAIGLYVQKTAGGAGTCLSVNNAGTDPGILIVQAGNGNAISISKTGAGAGAGILIANSGTGQDITGNSSNWYATKTGGVFSGKIYPRSATKTITTAGAITIDDGDGIVIADTNGGAGTDNLDTISGGSDGQVIIVRSADGARTVVARDDGASGGNLALGGAASFSMDSVNDNLMLRYDSTLGLWLELCRSNNS